MTAALAPSGSMNLYSVYSQPISGKMTVPVVASQSLYAQFRFVQGIPSAEGGFSIDRLQVIDSLIAQINAHRQIGTAPLKLQDVDLSKPDQTIQELSSQVHKMQSQPQAAFQHWGELKAQVFDARA